MLFQPLFQCGAVQGCQMDPVEAVFRGQHKGFGQVIAGHHFALLFCRLQKFPGPLGSGGVVQVKNTDDAPIPDCHIIADG